jgi:SSS family solute:Na+ symporter
MSHWTWIDTGVLLTYFLGMAALGPFFASKNTTTESYFLGDRSFPGWLVGFSMFATSISSVTFVAFPADAYKTAWFRMLLNLMLPIGVLVATFFFLPFFRKTHVTSAYEYLESRFGPYTRVYAACAFIIAQASRVSVILFLVSVLVQEMTGLPTAASIVVGGVVTAFYTVLGGIRAVIWTDFIQSLMLWVGGMLALVVIIRLLPGGIGQIFEVAWADGKFALSDLNAEGVLEPIQWSPDFTKKTVSLFLLYGISHWLAEYSANQNVVQRYAASKDLRQARIAMWVCCVFSIPTWAMFMFTGTALYVFYKVFPNERAAAMLSGAEKAEGILPYFVITYLPQGLSGLVIAGVLAAAMSSLSSSINSVSAVAVVDIYRRHLAPGKTDAHYVLTAKLIGIGLSLFMILGAFWLWVADSKTLQDTTTIITSVTAAGLLGIYLLGFFTKRGDDRAVLCGIAFALPFSIWMALTSLNWIPEALHAPIHNYYAGLIGHFLMFVVGFAAALAFPARPRDLRDLTVWTQDAPPPRP